MNTSLKGTGLRALGLLAIMMIICGVLYTGVMTGLTRLLFPSQTTGSVITVDGVAYGSPLWDSLLLRPTIYGDGPRPGPQSREMTAR